MTVSRELEELWLAIMTTSVLSFSFATADAVIKEFRLFRELSRFDFREGFAIVKLE